MQKKEDYKLYRLKSIVFGGFFGSPIVSGYLMYANYRAINEVDKAKNILLLSIAFTILLFVAIFQIPEEIIDRIPNVVFTAINAGIIYYYVKNTQGELLEKHEKENKDFHSWLRVFGISIVTAIMLLGVIFGVSYLSVSEEYYVYDEKMALFYLYEEEALDEYNQLEGKPITEVITTINTKIIPKWEQNIKVLEDVRGIENFPEDLIRENELLTQYSQLRIESFEALKKSIIFDNQQYNNKVDVIYQKIDSIIGLINTPQ